jgi:hypothetical protein
VGGFLLTYLQTRRFVGSSSDHPVHLFLTSVIRENRHRLFTRVPRILNESYCSAYPICMHWFLSFLGPRGVHRAALFQNAVANVLIVLVFYLGVGPLVESYWEPGSMGLAAIAVVLTPQYHHAFSARNHGLSARPMGLLFSLLFWIAYGWSTVLPGSLVVFAVMTVTAYLIWAFNTFATQALVIFSVLLGVLYSAWLPAFASSLGLLLFVAMHRDYAIEYLRHTVRFIRSYALYLSERFVLQRRPSVWRDLVWDIWRGIFRDVKRGGSYAYGNPVLILVFLNPLFLVSLWNVMSTGTGRPVGGSPFDGLIVVGAIVFLLTTFRPLRFLGEPERYLELLIPFSTAVGLAAVEVRFGSVWAVVTVLYFLAATGAQAFLGVVRVRTVVNRQDQMRRIAEVINAHAARGGVDVRFTSDNDQIVKFAMDRPWQFVRFWAADCVVAGYRLDQAFDVYPFLRPRVLADILVEYRINYFVLDMESPSSGDAGLELHELLTEVDSLRLFRVRSAPSESHIVPSRVVG